MSRALKAAKEAGIPGASGAKDVNDYKIENLASGYYVVEEVTEAPTDGSDYAVSALMLDTTTPVRFLILYEAVFRLFTSL